MRNGPQTGKGASRSDKRTILSTSHALALKEEEEVEVEEVEEEEEEKRALR